MKIFARFRIPPAERILAEMLNDLRDLQRSARHVNGLNWDLRDFVSAYPRIENWTGAKIHAHLRGLDVGPRRRDNIRDSLVTLARFARRKGYLPAEEKSEPEKVRKIKPGNDVVTWSPAQAEILLEHVSEKWLPCLAIGLFAGLRKSEILRLDWSAFKWQENPPVIAVSGKIARKIRISRLVPILPNLATWLEPYRDRLGAIYPGNFKTNENAFSDEMKRIRNWSGLPRKYNAARHSFGSYRLAILKNSAQVAEEMGNSPRKVRENYNDPKPESEAVRYFSLSAHSAENVMTMPLELRFG